MSKCSRRAAANRLQDFSAVLAELATVDKDPSSEPEGQFTSGSGLNAVLTRTQERHGLSDQQIEKITKLNSKGIRNGILKTPTARADRGTDAQRRALSQLLPPGTKFQENRSDAPALGPGDEHDVTREDAELEQDLKEALAELQTKDSDRAYFERQGLKRIVAWKAAAQEGDAKAQRLLARCLQEGIGIEKSPEVAVTWLRRAAGSGLACAQNDLGNCYYLGEGVEHDWTEGLHWYTRAAEQEFAWGQRNLGACYWAGEGVTKDFAQAVRWYRKAADQGLAAAMKDLGWCYNMGEGVDENPTEAVRWYRLAADLGHPVGQDWLADCYFEGYGVKQDYPQAISLYRKAADQQLASAQLNLGYCYAHGKGVKRNWEEAAEWYRLAADQGNDEAQFALGWCYEEGKGVEKDLDQATLWYRKAADQGHRRAKNALKKLQANGGPSGENAELIGDTEAGGNDEGGAATS